MDHKINDWNEEPVYYCPKCLSLKIKEDIADYCYCDDCGSTEVSTINIFEWENLYKIRYGYSFVKHN